MKILPETALAYDDVLLVPQYSNVDSRRKLSTTTRLTNQISLQIPIVSANMDVVTEWEMAGVAATRTQHNEVGFDNRLDNAWGGPDITWPETDF